MKLSSVIDQYGDLDVIAVIPNSDRMLSPAEIREIIGKEPYSIIKKMKSKYKLDYEEKVIPKSLLYKEYGLKEVI